MPFRDIEAFKNYLESIDEHSVEGSITIQEADTFIETDRTILLRLNEVIMVKELIVLIKKF